PLLRRVGDAGKPVLLKRGMATTIQEWLLSAEYVLARGNPNVILCERGIRTFEASTRFTLDLNAVPAVKKLSHLPILVDPSHGTGHWEFVEAMAMAGIAAGADGLIIEVHPRPEEALSDGPQSRKPERFAARAHARPRRAHDGQGPAARAAGGEGQADTHIGPVPPPAEPTGSPRAPATTLTRAVGGREPAGPAGHGRAARARRAPGADAAP